jgi:hypothetical protein
MTFERGILADRTAKGRSKDKCRYANIGHDFGRVKLAIESPGPDIAVSKSYPPSEARGWQQRRRGTYQKLEVYADIG